MTAYYHGGIPGLEVGDRILPPAITGESTKSSRSDVVCLCLKPMIAVMFAAFHPTGAGGVYEVDPDHPVEPDQDWDAPHESVQAPGATVLAALDPEPLISDFCGFSLTIAELRDLARRGGKLIGLNLDAMTAVR